VSIAPGAPPGDYVFEIGVYRLDDLSGVEIVDGAGDRIGQSFPWFGVRVERNMASIGDESLRGPGGRIDKQVVLLGSGIGQSVAAAGSSVDLTLLWKADAPPGHRDVIIRLLGPSPGAAVERRFQPGNGRHPAERWIAGEVVRDQLRLQIPPTLASGDYRVWAGLATPGGETGGLEIATLRVESVARSFELPPIENQLEADFGDGMRLKGWSLAQPRPGVARLTLFWHPNATPSRDYRVFNHVIDRSGRIVTQRDGVPVAWTRPTTGWIAGEAIEDGYDLELLPTDEPTLRLRVGVYEPIAGTRQRLPNGEDHIEFVAALAGP
jgi:hypothetical protein